MKSSHSLSLFNGRRFPFTKPIPWQLFLTACLYFLTVPTFALTPLTGVTQIWSQGKGSQSSHSCAILSGGGVKCWGWNNSGQLGDGSTTDRLTPVDVSGLTSGVTAIALGWNHSCALTSGGGVKCWGDNGKGQLGDDSTTNGNTPVDVIGLTSGVTAIALGWNHSCALTSGGGVKCWGWNSSGELGDGTATQRLTAVDVSGLTSGVTAIALGGYHSCALTSGGGVKCWGYNGNGGLGDGSMTSKYTPVDVSSLTSGVDAIALGKAHTCALTSGGGIKCWGYNDMGQLGDGSTTDKYTPVDVSGLTSGVTAIALGGHHSCAMTSGGGVKCWGANGSGLISGVTAIALGFGHSCALTSGGGVKCWGGGGSGQLGNNTTTESLTPVDVLMLAPEINVVGNAVSIVDGDITPSITDNTDFGSTPVGTPVQKTFTIQKLGELALNLTGTPIVTVTGTGFSVTVQPTTPVAATGSTTFTIEFAPTAGSGVVNGTVSIANDDNDENPYDFAISGTGLPATPSGLTATPVSTTQIDLSWTDNSADETGFKIESPAGTLITTTAANAISYSHTGLTCNTTYTYRLTAISKYGNSATVTTSATTGSCTAPPPVTDTDLTPYQETGLAVRVTIDGSGQGQVLSSVPGVDGKSIECSSANQSTGCQVNFAPATTVTLTPIPAEGSTFSGWGGHPDCQKESLFITGGVSCIAYFRTLIHPITLTVKGRGKVKGSHFDCQSDTTCTANYLEGTKLSWPVVRPRPSWIFGGWSGDCDSQGTVTITKTTQCQVTFLDDPNIPNDRDGNGDGLKDAYQDNVVSLRDEFTGDYLTLEVDKNCVIEDMYTDLLDVLPNYDQNRQYAQGLLYFDIVCAKTTVSLYLHRINKILRPFTLQKYGPTVPGDVNTVGWYTFPNVTFDVVKMGTQSVLRTRYELVDGQLGDNTGVDGHIIDPAVVTEGE